jgi:hypothetical protein
MERRSAHNKFNKNNMKKQIILFLSLFIGLTSYSQINYTTSDSIHIFWQPNIKIKYEDYQSKSSIEYEKLMNKYGISAIASIGIWSILDIPKKKKDRNVKFEKVYFAPAFDKTTSFARTDDSLQIEMQNLYFDICEIWARWARKELKHLQDSTNSTGILTIYYLTVKKQMEENRVAMNTLYFKEVFINKEDGALLKWKQYIEKLLEDTKIWATKPEECFRLMTKKPIEKGYIQSEFLVSPF